MLHILHCLKNPPWRQIQTPLSHPKIFKLILFFFDMGPLTSDPPKSLPDFISISYLPINIKQNDKYPSQ